MVLAVELLQPCLPLLRPWRPEERLGLSLKPMSADLKACECEEECCIPQGHEIHAHPIMSKVLATCAKDLHGLLVGFDWA